MVNKTIQALALGITIGFSSPALLADDFNGPHHRVAIEAFQSDDTDDQKYLNLLTGYDYSFNSTDYVGFRIGTRTYSDENLDEERDFDEFKLISHIAFSDNWYAHGTFSFISGETWDPTLFSLNTVYTPNEQWRFEAYLDKEIIDAILAVDNENMFTTAGVSIDYAVTREHILLAGISFGEAEDDNKRKATLLGYIWNPDWFTHGSFKFEAREKSYDFDAPDYFSPDKHEQYFVLIRYSTGLGKKQHWLFRFEGGPGRQYIDDERESAAKYKIEFLGPISEQSDMRIFYGCTSDDGEDDYEYCFGGAELYYKW